MRVDSRPMSLLGEQMRAALYPAHPYSVPVIGWRNEIVDSGHGVFDQEGLVTHVFGTVLGLNKDRCLGRLTTIASAYNTNVVTPLNERLRQCDQARRFARATSGYSTHHDNRHARIDRPRLLRRHPPLKPYEGPNDR